MENIEQFKEMFGTGKPGHREITRKSMERPEVLKLVQYWVMNGATQREIYEGLGIPQSTWYLWREKIPKLEKALQMTPQFANSVINAVAFQNAAKGDPRSVEWWQKHNDPRYASRQPLPAAQDVDEKVSKIDQLLGSIETAVNDDEQE